MTKQEIRNEVQKGHVKWLTFRELRREARRRFWAKDVSPKMEGDTIERMPAYELVLYVTGSHPEYN